MFGFVGLFEPLVLLSLLEMEISRCRRDAGRVLVTGVDFDEFAKADCSAFDLTSGFGLSLGGLSAGVDVDVEVDVAPAECGGRNEDERDKAGSGSDRPTKDTSILLPPSLSPSAAADAFLC